MKEKFDTLSKQFSKITTVSYSTSFSMGILFLDKKLRSPIYSIYGFVRFADEIVDSFHGYDKAVLLEKFRCDTYDAIENRISLNPILNSFQHAVHEYRINIDLIDTFLDSMAMDLRKEEFNRNIYEKYILGSAEVVGLMCLKVFTNGNELQYEEMRPYAMKLGAAFQKVNFLRDLRDDYEDLGRNYFPGFSTEGFSNYHKKLIEAEIEVDFKEALSGIKKLPGDSRRGVYLAYYYYKSLFGRIKRTPIEVIMKERVRISNFYKFFLMINSYFRHQLNML